MGNIPNCVKKLGGYVLSPCVREYVLSTSVNILSIFEYIFKYRNFKSLLDIKSGSTNHKQDIASVYKILKRLSDAYIKAEMDGRRCPPAYQPSYKWKKIINDRFGDIISSIRNNNFVKLQTLLENFHRERFSICCGGVSAFDYREMKISSLYRYQFVSIWCKSYLLYKEKVGNDHLLTYPQMGNPLGLYHNGQIIPLDAFRYHYYATEILSLLRNVNNPVICEIGGGLGGQAYATLSQGSNKHITYILMDLPEVLILAAYFLMVSFPEKKILLYGEEETMNLRDKLDQYDIILMPTFVLPQLGDKTVDLFFSAFCLSETSEIIVKEYLRQIERICRIYFMYMDYILNFVWYKGGKKQTNQLSTQVIPNPKLFKKIYEQRYQFCRPRVLLDVYLCGLPNIRTPRVFLYKRIY